MASLPKSATSADVNTGADQNTGATATKPQSDALTTGIYIPAAGVRVDGTFVSFDRRGRVYVVRRSPATS